jgi:hypothetical protein
MKVLSCHSDGWTVLRLNKFGTLGGFQASRDGGAGG